MSVTMTFFIAIVFSAIAVSFAGSMGFTQNFKLFPVVLVSGVLGLIFLYKFMQMYLSIDPWIYSGACVSKPLTRLSINLLRYSY